MQSQEGLEDTPFSKMPTIKALDFLGQKLFLDNRRFSDKKKTQEDREFTELKNPSPPIRILGSVLRFELQL